MEKTQKKVREKQPKAKNDPQMVQAARELRDRWLEYVNAEASGLIGTGKYEIARALPAGESGRLGNRAVRALEAA
ncbi:MAG: hypothetical protein ABIO94_02640 [Opitutaceae bacterium]